MGTTSSIKANCYSNSRVAANTDRIPLGRPAHPDEVANVVAFLVSSDSTYMTGQALNVTGGLLMH